MSVVPRWSVLGSGQWAVGSANLWVFVFVCVCVCVFVCVVSVYVHMCVCVCVYVFKIKQENVQKRTFTQNHSRHTFFRPSATK